MTRYYSITFLSSQHYCCCIVLLCVVKHLLGPTIEVDEVIIPRNEHLGILLDESWWGYIIFY